MASRFNRWEEIDFACRRARERAQADDVMGAHRFSAAAAGALTKREAERRARELRKAGTTARVGRAGQTGYRVVVEAAKEVE